MHEAVQELAVVGDHQQRALVAAQEALEPDERFEIQVVGGLVEQHGVGAHEKNAGQGDAHFPATGERGHRAIDDAWAEAEAGENFACARLEGVAVELVEAALDLAEALHQFVELIGEGRICQLVFELFELVGHRGDRACPPHGLFEDRAFVHFADVLLEVAERDAAIDGDGAFVGNLLLHDVAEEGRFPGAVGADQAGLLAFVDRERGADEEDLLAML